MEPIRNTLPRSAPWTVRGAHARIRRILADPQRWIKGSLYDFNPDRNYMHTRDTATKCCLAGALQFVPENHSAELMFHVKKLLWDCGGTDIVSEFNDQDSTTHALILQLWDYVRPKWLPWSVFGCMRDWFVEHWGERGIDASETLK